MRRRIQRGSCLLRALVIGCASALLVTCATHAPTATSPPNASPVAHLCGCIDENGNVVTTPSVVQSSGNARLDEGALKLAQAGCNKEQHIDPKSLPHCVKFKVKFMLHEQPK